MRNVAFNSILLDRKVNSKCDSYIRFSIDEVFPEEFAERLCATFPSSILLKQIGDSLYASADLNKDSLDINSFFSENSEWAEYREYVRSTEFLCDAINLFRIGMANRYLHFWKFLFGWRTKTTKRLFTTMQVTLSRRGSCMSPHSDDKYNVISFIHYFPVSGSVGQQYGGTRFFEPYTHQVPIRKIRKFSDWSIGLKRYFPFWCAASFEGHVKQNIKIGDESNPDQRPEFLELFHEVENFSYLPNRMIGFVKNSWSFHEVDLKEFPVGEDRRALLINIRMKPARISVLFDRAISMFQ